MPRIRFSRFGFAIVVSLALHLALGPFVRKMPEAIARQEPPPGTIYLITPEPRRVIETPTPTPIPTPHRLEPPPRAFTSAAPSLPLARRLPRRVRAPRAVAVASGAPVETRGMAGTPVPGEGGTSGSSIGVGAGGGGAGTASPVATVEASPPTPTPTPKPMCAKPQVDAHVIDTVEPVIPEIARQQGAVGSTSVKVDLSELGNVAGVSIDRSSGNAALDAAAMDAARRSTYAAEIRDCRAEPGSYLFRVEFDG